MGNEKEKKKRKIPGKENQTTLAFIPPHWFRRLLRGQCGKLEEGREKKEGENKPRQNMESTRYCRSRCLGSLDKKCRITMYIKVTIRHKKLYF